MKTINKNSVSSSLTASASIDIEYLKRYVQAGYDACQDIIYETGKDRYLEGQIVALKSIGLQLGIELSNDSLGAL